MPTSITLPDSLADRIGAVASQSHRTPLCIIQLCLAAHLPVLEEAAKHLAVFHPELAAGKLPSPAPADKAIPNSDLPNIIWSAVKEVTKRKKATFTIAVAALMRFDSQLMFAFQACKALNIPHANSYRIQAELKNIPPHRQAEVNAICGWIKEHYPEIKPQ